MKKCHYFPHLHQIYSAHPSINPPAVTTGVGPSGHTIIYHQPTQESSSASPIPDTFTPTFSDELTNRLLVPPSQHSISSFSIPSETSTASFQPLSQRSMVSERALSATHASIKVIPKKWTFEEGILETQ